MEKKIKAMFPSMMQKVLGIIMLLTFTLILYFGVMVNYGR